MATLIFKSQPGILVDPRACFFLMYPWVFGLKSPVNGHEKHVTGNCISTSKLNLVEERWNSEEEKIVNFCSVCYIWGLKFPCFYYVK